METATLPVHCQALQPAGERPGQQPQYAGGSCQRSGYYTLWQGNN